MPLVETETTKEEVSFWLWLLMLMSTLIVLVIFVYKPIPPSPEPRVEAYIYPEPNRGQTIVMKGEDYDAIISAYCEMVRIQRKTTPARCLIFMRRAAPAKRLRAL